MSPAAVYSYLRFSSPKQLLGDSKRRQLENTRRYCAERGWKLDESLQDEGLSAYTGKHRTKGALSSFLTKVDAGQIPQSSVLICEHLDRLSREDVTDALSQFINIINAGITIITLQDGKIYNKAEINKNSVDLMFSIMLMTKANAESVDKAKRIKEVMAQQRKEGKKVGNCPYWLKRDGDKYAFESEATELVKRIVQMIRDGDGVNRIARKLNKEGVKSLNGKTWHHLSVRRIVANPALYGARYSKKYDEYTENMYPPVVTKSEYVEIQEIIKSRTHVRGRMPDEIQNIFSGVIRCGNCGAKMRYIQQSYRKGRKDPASFTCINHKLGAGCNQSNYVGSMFLENVIIDFVKEVQEKALQNKAPNPDDGIKLMILQKEKELKKYLKLVQISDDPPDSLVHQMKAVETELKGLRNKLNTNVTVQPTMLPENVRQLPRNKLHSLMLQIFDEIEIDRTPKSNTTVNFKFKNGNYGTLIWSEKTNSLWEYMVSTPGGGITFTVDQP